MKPLLFMDVDGVLNCPSPGNLDAPTHQLRWPRPDLGQRLPFVEGLFEDRATRDPDTMTQRVWVPAGAIERVRTLAERFECVWATSWRAAAAPAWGPLLAHQRPWPTLTYDGDFKLQSIPAYRPWAFIDDDALWELDHVGPLPAEPAHLIVQTDPHVGLGDEHAQQLLAFAAGR